MIFLNLHYSDLKFYLRVRENIESFHPKPCSFCASRLGSMNVPTLYACTEQLNEQPGHETLFIKFSSLEEPKKKKFVLVLKTIRQPHMQ